MKKIFAILTVITLALSLCACPALEQEATSGKPQVHITVGKIEPGMTVKDVFVEVTINNQPVPCRVQLTGFVWDGYWEMAADEPVPEPFAVRVDIFYSLPKGCDVEDVDITMDSDGGNYDGTGSISNDEDGNIEAWSRAFYGKEPLPPETEPTEATTQPTEAPTQPTEAPTQPTEAPTQPTEAPTQPTETPTPPTEAPTPPTEAPTQPVHTHTWVEQPGPGIIDCTLDREKNFKCSCGETKTEIIPAPGHDLKDWTVTPATCTEEGQKTTSCKRCSAGFTVELPAIGHIWSAWVNETGLVHKRTCSECGAEEEASHNIPSGSVTCTDCGADIIN